MKVREKKRAILETLRGAVGPKNLPSLLTKLGPEFKERTLRRLLSQMVEEGQVKRTGAKRSTHYQLLYTRLAEEQTPDEWLSTDSLEVVKQTKKPIFQRTPSAYKIEWMDTYEPNRSFYLSKEQRAELQKAGKRASRHEPAGTYAHKIYDRLLIDLSYNSSRLEGNTYSLLETQQLIRSGKSPEGKLREEKVMILNHKEAIRYLVDHAYKLVVSCEMICTLHYLLAEGLIDPGCAGKVRDHWVRISGSTYIPLEGERLLQHQLIKIAEKAQRIEDPFEQSLFLLIHISYLQAFSDVNKRTARLNANIPLIISNLVPLSFNDVDREDYISAMLAIYELQDTRPIVDLFLFSYLRTCIAYDETVKSIGFDEIRVRYRQERRALLRTIIVEKIKGALLEKQIQEMAKKEIPENDRGLYIEDVYEDLELMDKARTAGLGITPEQLDLWKNQ